jgi:predicted nucleic acid-binding protein
MFPTVPLRTLDALHLALAREIPAGVLATADKTMAVGAKRMGLSVQRFF